MRTRTGLLATTLIALAFLSACGGSGGGSPAGQSVRTVGLMHVGTDHNPPSLEALVTRLGELGWFAGSPDGVMRQLVGDETKVGVRMSQLQGQWTGRKIKLIWRNLDADQAPAQAKKFVRDRVDVIVAFEDTSIRAAQDATSRPENRIPVVFLHPSDAVRDDLVGSRAKPRANFTGVFGARDPIAKQLELYEEIMPRLHRVLTLVDPLDPATSGLLAKARTTAAHLPRPLELDVRKASDADDLSRIFHSLRPGEVDGAFLVSPSLRLYQSELTIQLARQAGLPVQAHRKEWAQAGALFSLGVDVRPVGRAGARFVASILKGTPPAKLPVEEVPKVEFALNLKTAHRLGITVPRDVILRADEVYR
jgi:putative tryptophan/tyrosine transport system substrate-binding protein